MVQPYRKLFFCFHYFLLVLGFLALLICELNLVSFEQIDCMYVENSFFELMTLFYLSIAIFITFEKKKYLFMVLLIFFFLEESSYGQWFFFFETPEWLKTINVQKEFNFHNIRLWDDFDLESLLVLAVLIFAVISPIMYKSERIKELFIFSWPYSIEVGLLFVLTLLFGSELPGSPSEEVFEYGVSFILMKSFL